MARVKNNIVIEGLVGTLGKNLLIRVVNGQTIISQKPGKRTKPPSEKQKARQVLFKEAVAWAKKQLQDKTLEAELRAECKGNQSPNSLLIARYMRESKG